MKRLGAKKIIGIIVLILIIVLIAFGIIYTQTDLFMDPQKAFYHYLGKSIQTEETELSKEAQMYLTNRKEKKSEVSGDITVENNKVNYVVQMDPFAKKIHGQMETKEGQQDVKLEVILQNETLGIKIDKIYDKYIAIENRELKSLAKKVGMEEENVPDKIEFTDYNKILQVDQSKLIELKDRYHAILKEEIPKENYKREKNVVIEGKEIQGANSYTLSLTKEEVQHLLIKILETAKTDDTLLDILLEKNNELNKLDAEEFPTLTKEALRENIEKEIENIKTDEGITDTQITIYEKQGNVIQLKIEDKEDTLIWESENTNTNSHLFLFIKIEDQTMSFKTDTRKEEEKTIQEMEFLVQDSINTNKIKIKMEYDGALSADVVEGKGEMTIQSDDDTITATINNKVDFTKDVTIEEFNEENADILNDMSQSQIYGLMMRIYGNLLMNSEKVQLPSDIL